MPAHPEALRPPARCWPSVVLLGVTVVPVWANPISLDPLRNTVHGYGATLAFVIEVSVTASLLGILSGIEEKVRLVLALLFMNAVTFGVFILWLHPFIGSVVITEALVWLTETMVVTMITRRLGDRPLSFVWCLPITALGNLCSFFAGLA